MRQHAEIVAAAVNGVVTLLLPATLMIPVVLGLGPANPPVRPPDASQFRDVVRLLLMAGPLMLPLAGVAAWRTWAHAVSWRERGTRGWQGVAEGGAVGLLLALWILAVPTIMRPRDAPPYIIVYGGLAAGIGLVIVSCCASVRCWSSDFADRSLVRWRASSKQSVGDLYLTGVRSTGSIRRIGVGLPSRLSVTR